MEEDRRSSHWVPQFVTEFEIHLDYETGYSPFPNLENQCNDMSAHTENILLELLTGRKPVDHTMPREAKPRLTQDKTGYIGTAKSLTMLLIVWTILFHSQITLHA
uniref:Uncharacterized protein n=1 Tax=Oryza barthii TaxID=65489 RepID=A0A0D3EXF0_9ORYZ